MNDIVDQFRIMRWKAGIACVFCKSKNWQVHSWRLSGVRRYRCLSCRRIFSDVSGTFLESSKLPFTKWHSAAILFLQDRTLSPRTLERLLKVSYPTAHRLINFFHRVLRAKELQKKTGTFPEVSKEIAFADTFLDICVVKNTALASNISLSLP